jgi:chromate reductase
MSEKEFHVLGICGSLRSKSYNMSLLKAASELLPQKVRMEIYGGLEELPLYNEDLQVPEEPEAVRRLKEVIRQCKVLLIATPEYNFGVPAPLKNAIDWVSALSKDNPLEGKAVGIMGASPGAYGTARAQLSLRQTLHATESLVMLQPELLVSNVSTCFDEHGNLIDEEVRVRLRHFLLSLLIWSRKAALLAS